MFMLCLCYDYVIVKCLCYDYFILDHKCILPYCHIKKTRGMRKIKKNNNFKKELDTLRKKLDA